MALPYELRVSFEEFSGQSTLDGMVAVTVHETCTCRKLRLQWGKKQNRDTEFSSEGKAQTLADWVEWRAGETYTYPFVVNADNATTANWAVKTEAHRIGEWDTDPPQVWLVEQIAQPGQKESSVTQQEDFVDRNTNSNRPMPTRERLLVQHVSLEFERGSADFAFGENISGTVTFIPARDIVEHMLGLDYQWRAYGNKKQRSGEHRPVSISGRSSWKGGEQYQLPFRFYIPSGPWNYSRVRPRAKWYVWPVLIPLDGSVPVPFLHAESEIRLLPPRIRKVRNTIWLQLHALGCFVTGLATFALVVGIAFAIGSSAIGSSEIGSIATILVGVLVAFLVPVLYGRLFSISCPDCGSRLEMRTDDVERPFIQYECPDCFFHYETIIPTGGGDWD